jgi:hypothetical protein
MSDISIFESRKGNLTCTARECFEFTTITFIDTAVSTGYIGAAEVETLRKWRVDPSVWG